MTRPRTSAKAGVLAQPQPPAPTPPSPAPQVAGRVACPICQTAFDPRASAGACPVCGERVVPAELVTRPIPVVTPVWQWLRAGGWRLVALVMFMLYELVLFLGILHQFSQAHLLK